MNEKHASRNRNIVIGALLAIILIMGVGFAAFAQQLTISGTSTISSNWDVHIESVSPTSITGTASDAGTHIDNATQATFEANLQSPGDSITYDVVIKNGGNVDAKVAAANGINFEPGENSAVIDYSYTGIDTGTVINHGESITVKVTVKFVDNPEGQGDPAIKTNDLTMTMNFEQA